MSLEDIARVTRIPERSLDRLERGDFESLPADVFVRGFLRSYAQCVGLDADDALRRYIDCGLTSSPVSQLGSRRATTARGELAQGTPAPERVPVAHPDPAPAPASALARGSVALEPVVLSVPVPAAAAVAAVASEPAPAPASAAGTKKKRKQRRKRKSPSARAEAGIRASSAALEPGPAAAPAPAEPLSAASVAPVSAAPARSVTPPRMVIAIDDEAPDDAERVLSARTERDTAEREASRRAFLPPALLDHEDGSRRGALTLAVIILVIVATLTMSYLLRRPSSSGSGVTELAPHSEPVQSA